MKFCGKNLCGAQHAQHLYGGSHSWQTEKVESLKDTCKEVNAAEGDVFSLSTPRLMPGFLCRDEFELFALADVISPHVVAPLLPVAFV